VDWYVDFHGVPCLLTAPHPSTPEDIIHARTVTTIFRQRRHPFSRHER
jgi:hypothetical protein